MAKRTTKTTTEAKVAETATEETKAPTSVTDLPETEEVAERTTDTEAEATQEYRKVFVLGPGTYGKDYDHGPNKAATRQYAIAVGLWPTEDVARVGGVRTHADGVSKVLTYKVAVRPAHRVPGESENPEVTSNGDPDEAANADAGK